MSRNEFHSNNLPNPTDILDLHGCTKSDAISRTTDFLDRSNRLLNSDNTWVLVITGSGAHSPHGRKFSRCYFTEFCAEMFLRESSSLTIRIFNVENEINLDEIHMVLLAVLRGAIEALLIKRKIVYYLLKGKGSFLVNAASGFVLYEPSQPRDSKVMVAPTSVSGCVDGANLIRRSILERQLSENREGNRKALKKQFHSIRKEEAAYDEAISKSLEEKERAKAEDKETLQQAMNLSLMAKQKETDEEQKLCEAIEISKRESVVNAMDEDEQILKTLALSKVEFDQQSDPDVYLQQIIELSRRERSNDDDCKHGENQEDEGLLKALELSVVDF